MRMRVSVVVFLSILIGTGAGAEGPMPVSPGGPEGLALVSGRCPTFHWTEVAAESVDLVVYRVPQEEVEGPPARVLSVTLPATAGGWTPSLGQCLEPGGRYAWSVGTEGRWSEVSLFEVSAAPSVAEVDEVLALLRRYAVRQVGRANGGGEALRGPTAEPAPSASSMPGRAPAQPQAAAVAGGPSVADTSDAAGSPPPRTVTPPDSYALTIDGDLSLGGFVFKEALPFLHTDGGYDNGNTALGFDALVSATIGVPDQTSGRFNTAVGRLALQDNSSGRWNTAVGNITLRDNTSGSMNTAIGGDAMRLNRTGSYNTALGEEALAGNLYGDGNTGAGYLTLFSNGSGSYNTAVGYRALERPGGDDNTGVGSEALRHSSGERNTALGSETLKASSSVAAEGDDNTATGFQALTSNTSGDDNTAVGSQALHANLAGKANVAVGSAALRNTTGSRNIALGKEAGWLNVSGDDNIFIGHIGATLDESDAIRIGTAGTHTATFIAGIHNTPLDAPVHAVWVDADGKLGLDPSSRRYKSDIRDIGRTSRRLLDLRPVAFRFGESSAAGQNPVQFGLIAEEVAEVLPELVAFDRDGKPQAVRYHLLSSLLLNELQKQHRMNQAQWVLIGFMLLATAALTAGRWGLG